MTADEFAGLVGETLTHVTLAENMPGVRALGLMRPMMLARLAKRKPGDLLLRDERLQLDLGKHTARLNSQFALRFGIASAATFLDGHTIESWSEQLDGRIYFWPQAGGEAFGESHGEHRTSTLVLDSRRFFERLGPAIDLAPVNTGSARRKPARRGDWIYVPATRASEDFRLNRVRMGLKKTPDTVTEVSLRADIPPDILQAIMAG
jgi:hypothetical protein